jgi:hypothetical protein
MIARYREEDIHQKVIASGRLDPEVIEIIENNIESTNQNKLSRRRLAIDLLQGPLKAIQKEKNKYEQQSTEDSIDLDLRFVKGIPFGLWGLNAGVCIASDISLWKDPNFYLVPMIDKKTKAVNGFIHVYETEIKGKKYWTLPGIEPSTEFMGTINPEELYDKLIERTLEFAKEEGVKIQGIYIPTNPNILSNRSDIQKVIKSKNYPTKEIPEVNWSRITRYPFSEIFVVWENK